MSVETEEVVVATVVPDHLRLKQLPRFFGKALIVVEGAIYGFATQLSEDYTGGFWTFHTLSNGGFYMTPPNREAGYKVTSPNGESATVGADAMGVIACMFAYSHSSFSLRDPEQELVADAYHHLRDYALSHPERKAIFAILD